MTLDPLLLLSVFSSAFGCALFYVYLTVRVPVMEFIKSLFGTLAIGVVAYTIAVQYLPANSEMVNRVVIPFFSGFTMPSLLRGYATFLYKFSQDPEKQAGVIAKLISMFRKGDDK